MRCWPAWLGPIRTSALLLLFAGCAPLRAVTATLLADTHVNSDRPDVNSGAISNLAVGTGYTALLQFDLSSLPVGTTAAQVSRATLRLYVNRADTPGVVQVQTLSGSWGEYSVTYTSLPALGASVGQIPVTQAAAYVTLDVTALVQGWLTAPASNHGVALTAASAAVQLDSKENELTGHVPELEVVLATSGVAGPQGLPGPAGPAGPQGAMGARGSTGAQGTAGPTGPAGATGPQGPPGGLSYQGNFFAATTYATGAVVSFGGSSWVSLISSNRGNAPSLTSNAWGLLAQAQPGATGATGPQGSAGPQGVAGAMGLQGPAGTAGTMGPRGLPGLTYQGSYSTLTNYAAGDVVSWQGASYVSLAGSNHANPPDANAGWWSVLSAQGPIGAAGPQGPMGPQGVSGPAGSVGPAGERGPQGVQGIPGQTGAQGVPGSQGPQGVQGPAGPQGPTGAVGLTFRGAYNASTNYALSDAVSYNGASYVSLQSNNSGNTPDRNPTQWAMFAAAGAAGPVGPSGPTGATGPQGPQGTTGMTGPQGAAGPAGPQGPAVANFTGAYNPATAYALNDAVGYGGSTYVSVTASNHGNTPGSSPAQWALLVAKGDSGAAGPTGAQGPAGATGPAGPAGPAGATGSAGARGPTGAIGIVPRGTWSAAINYNANDAVTYGGATYLAQASSSAVQPDQSTTAWAVLAAAGVAGPTGPGGSAATVTVGSVTTGAAGSAATVTNSGTSTAAVLNFSIPQGASGAAGGGGGSASGTAPTAVYHSVSFNFNYWSAVNANASLAETDGTVLTWVPNGCTATKLQVFSMQGKAITVTLRAGPQGALAAAMSCQVSSGSSCTALGSVAVPAGGFMDLQVAGANGTAAPVWTAVTCE